jgi:hypothetical protein
MKFLGTQAIQIPLGIRTEVGYILVLLLLPVLTLVLPTIMVSAAIYAARKA